MADVAAPAQTQTLTPSLARERSEAHPCNARPDLHPAGGPPLGAGLIHENASDHLANFIRTCLRESGYARAVVSKDPLLHADRSEEPSPNGLLYTRPSILAYKALAAHREPANAYHLGYDGPPDLVVEILSESTWKKDVGVGREIVDKMRYYRSVGVSEYWIYNPELLQQQQGIRFFTGYALQGNRYVPIKCRGRCWPSAVLGTMWERGDRHRSNGSEPYMLMRLRKPDSREWYPTADEKDAELEAMKITLAEKNAELEAMKITLAEKNAELKATKITLAEKNAKLEATKTALERAEAEKKDALLTDPQALLDYYERKFGPLDRENPDREPPPSTLQA